MDPHFSQFYAYPLWLNPGMTGVMDGDIRITALYRNQWSDVMVPFNTAGLSVDVATSKNINFGASFLNQTAGDAGYRYTNAYGSIAYSGVKFGNEGEQHITIGIQAGMLSRSFDPSKFQYGDQWNPVTGFDPSAPTGDQIKFTSVGVLDVNAGISYYDGGAGKKVNAFAGAGVFHLTRPEDPFYATGTSQRLPMRFAVHAGARIAVNERFSITPNILYLKQGNASEQMAGVFAQLGANEYTDVLFGVNYRVKDAVSPYFGVAFHNFVVGASYDVNISDLGKAVTGTNAIEFSLTYITRKAGKPLRYLGCPRF